MNCPECELLLAQGETNPAVERHLSACADCRALAEDLRANAVVLDSLRQEEMPRLEVRPRHRANLLPWVAGLAAAAALAIAMWLPTGPRAPLPSPPEPAPPSVPEATSPQPLKIKMLTPDPNVVIYWIVD